MAEVNNVTLQISSGSSSDKHHVFARFDGEVPVRDRQTAAVLRPLNLKIIRG
jgi:hypothetical protein